ncbi:2-phospho-L-lactate guanylyltransferase [Pseudomonadota bacterium]
MPGTGRGLKQMPQALVPLKDLVQAKTRLAGLLRPSERRALAQAMLEDVLQVLTGHPHIERVTLLSDDPAAPLLARQWGVDHWPEGEHGGCGLNQVVSRASEQLLQDRAEPLLVLHADLPLLTSGDISAVLASYGDKGGLVIGSDNRGTGTNLLAFGRVSMPRFCFGPDSCARHLAAARQAAIAARIIQRAGIALDVDEPRDLAELLAALPDVEGGHTKALLDATTLGGRISLALASLAPLNSLQNERGEG